MDDSTRVSMKALKKPQPTKRVKKVLIVDDHPMLRKGLAELIGHEPDLGSCGEADDIATALEEVKAKRPDLVIVDISLRESNGLELVKELKAQFPKLKMLMCSMHEEDLYAERALRAGAMGYINKERAIDDVVDAIRCVLAGRVYLSDRMADRILNRVRGGGGEAQLKQGPMDQLTDRELEVFELFGNGMSTSEIAERLCLSPKTIDAHRQKIKRKLDIGSTSELMQYAVKWVLEETKGVS